jgi:alginate O-acetyltransferase complex protein AlgJ
MKRFLCPPAFLPLAFILVITLPLVFTIAQKDEKISIVEKRRLAALPEFDFSFQSLEEFPKAFEAYFADHFSFRNEFVRLHNRIMLFVLATSPSKFVIAGQDHWYYFNSDGAFNDYMGLERFAPVDLERFKHVLQDREYWLDTLGAHYLFLPVPNKETIYEEYLPGRVRNNRGMSKVVQLTEHLRTKSRFRGLVDIHEHMLQEKSRQQLYLKTDSHWTVFGADLAYRGIMAPLQGWFPDLVPTTLQVKWQEEFSGDLAVLMNLRGVVAERAPVYDLQPDCTVTPLRRMDELLQFEEFRKHHKIRMPVRSGCEEGRYTAIFIHDSFGNTLRPLMTPAFRDIIYVNNFNMENIKALIEAEKPDVVIDQRVYRNIANALVHDPALEAMVLQNKYRDEAEKIVEMNKNNWQNYLEPTAAATQDPSGQLVFHSTEVSPVLKVRVNPDGRLKGSSIVRISVESPHDTHLSICFHADKAKEQALNQCETRPLNKGSNEVFVRIFNSDQIESAGITCAEPGRYRINELTIKNEN